MEQKIKICNTCGKKGELIGDWETPLKWFRLDKLSMCFRKNTKRIKSKHQLIIDEHKDPDFCSIECAVKWFETELKKIM